MRPDYQMQKKRMITMIKNFPWADKMALGDYLAQTYYYVNHSERLLAIAAGLMTEDDRKIQRRFFHHLGEENAHDLLAKKDLENLGYKLEDFPERVETRIFWETQYYKIEHEDPCALMGYILLLEDVASEVCLWMYQEITKYHGKKCGTFLRVHGEEDPGHVGEAMKVIESLSSERQLKIFQNLYQSEVAYCQMLSAIVENCGAKTLKKAA
jgi:pyrroloquinoline quinone (PQQ) biosynthesis protein C